MHPRCGTKEKQGPFGAQSLGRLRSFWQWLERQPFVQSLLLAFLLNLAVEMLSRRSFIGGWIYLGRHPLLFCYNAAIILLTLTPALLCRKRYFMFALVSVLWLGLGITNCVLLSFRTTPLAAIDFEIAESVITIIDVYLSPLQLILIGALLLLTGTGLVLAWIKAPKLKARTGRALFLIAVLGVLFSITTSQSRELQALSGSFANIVEAYDEYGFAYCFSSSLVDRGIDRPDSYSPELIRELTAEIKEADGLEENVLVQEELPNVVFLQLESFFDVNYLKNVAFSENPLPHFTALKEENSHGFLTVPSIGGGTANTEFEVLTGMSLDFFGTGEYPYKTILQSQACGSLAYDMKELGYKTHAMHNNTGTFYDRNRVYPNLGFDSFTPLEYMQDVETNPTGWAKDRILTREIQDVLNSTRERDFVFAVSVQAHGKYPSSPMEDPEILVYGLEEEKANSFTYYVNQLHEVDAFLGELTAALTEYPEPVVLVLYGDHLPTSEYESEDLANGSSFETEYVLWSNRSLEQKEQNLYAYQLSAYILQRLGFEEGLLGKLHQNYFDAPLDPGYNKALELLEYDLLYGEGVALAGQKAYEPTQMQMGTGEIRLTEIQETQNTVFALGGGFTQWSKILINGEPVETQWISETLLKAPDQRLEPTDQVTVGQVCENLTLLGQTAPGKEAVKL